MSPTTRHTSKKTFPNRLARITLVAMLSVSTVTSTLTPAWAQTPSAPATVLVNNDTLLKLIPANAVMVAMWGGTQTPEFQSSKLAKVLASDAWQKLWGEQVPEALKATGEETIVEKYKKTLGYLKDATDHAMAVYLLAPPTPDGEPTIVGLIDGGDKADELAAMIEKLREEEKGEKPPTMTKIGNVLMVASVEQLPEVKENFTASPSYQTAIKAMGQPLAFTPSAFVHLEMAKPISMLQGIGKDGPGKQRADLLLNGVGFKTLHSFTFRAGIDSGGDWASEAFIHAPAAERKGLIGSLFTPRSGPEPLLSRVPADVIAVEAVEFDLPTLLNDGIKLATEMNPETPQELDFIWSKVTAVTGVKLKEEFLDQFGAHWIVYETSPAAPGQSGQIVAINKARNGKKVLQSVYQLCKSAQNFLVMQGNQNPQLPKLLLARSKTADGALLLDINLQVDPALLEKTPALKDFTHFAVAEKEGLLFLGQGDAVKAALTAPSTSITASEKYQSLMTRLGAPAASGVGFQDLPRSASAVKAQLANEVALLETMELPPGIDIKGMIDSLFNALEPQLSPSANARWVDEAGYHFRSVSPVPGGEFFSRVGAASSVGVGTGAVAVSILLPSLNRARETANRVKSASNLRMIGTGMMLYANENTGKFPPTLGDVLKTQDVTIDVFVSPRTSTSIPPEIRNGDKDAKAAWVSEHGDYEYVGADLNNSAHPDVILAYERLDRGLTDGINVLFADGHVEFHMLREWPEIKKRSDEARERK